MAEPTGLHLEIWRFLVETFAGIENASPRSAILQPICTAPSTGYYLACGEQEKQVSLNYLDSVLTEVGDRRRNLADAVPLGAKPKQERLF